jgi:regulator of protease activity HflC (stomatin/prohibitin superfamily)
VFPGNVQEVMNRVLVAERTAQAQLVEARTRAQSQQIDAQAKADVQRVESEAYVHAQRSAAQAAAESQRIKTEAEMEALKQTSAAGDVYSSNPSLLRLRELETLRELARNANARIYIGFDKHMGADEKG